MVLKKGKNAAKLNDFMDNVIQSGGTFDENTLKRLRATTHDDSRSDTDCWIQWREATCSFYDEDALKEMVESGEVASRRNQKLKPDSKVPWPRNLEIFHVRTTHTKKQNTRDETVLQEGQDLNPETHQAFIEQSARLKMTNKLGEAGASSSHGLASADSASERGGSAKSGVDAPTKACLVNIRKWHTAFDRARREWCACVADSANYDTTRGSKVESDLSNLGATGARDR